MSSLRYKRLLLGSNLALSQLMLAASSVAVTSFVAREGRREEAAIFFASYAIESIGVSAARGYTLSTFIARSGIRQIARADASRTLRVTARTAIVTAAAIWVFTLLASDGDLYFALATTTWCLSIQLFDTIRPIVALYGAGTLALGLVALNLIFQTLASIAGSEIGLESTILLSSAVFVILGILTAISLWRHSAPDRVSVLQRERHFAQAQLWEQGGSATVVAVAMVLLALFSPASTVALQLANQVVTAPASLLLGSIGLAALRSISDRVLRGDDHRGLRNQWIAFGVLIFVVATMVAMFEPGLLERLFGPAWLDARTVVAWLAALSVTQFIGQVIVYPFRSTAPATLFRNWNLLAISVAQIPLVLGAMVFDVPGLAVGAALAATFVVACYRRLFVLASQASTTATTATTR